MKIVLAVLLLIHGLIVAAQATSGLRPSTGVPNPSWLAWWPTGLGQSWLVSGFNLGRPPFTWLLGLGWLAGGLLLIASGLALLGILLPQEMWGQLATWGAVISLVMLLLYLHPLFLLGIAASSAILVALLRSGSPLANILGA